MGYGNDKVYLITANVTLALVLPTRNANYLAMEMFIALQIPKPCINIVGGVAKTPTVLQGTDKGTDVRTRAKQYDSPHFVART